MVKIPLGPAVQIMEQSFFFKVPQQMLIYLEQLCEAPGCYLYFYFGDAKISGLFL